MDFAGRQRSRQVTGNRPCAALVLADREERDVAEQLVTRADDAIEPRFHQAEIREERGGVSGVELCDLELDLRAYGDGARRGSGEKLREARGFGGLLRVLGDVRYVDVQDNQQRLGRQKLKTAEPLQIVALEIQRA